MLTAAGIEFEADDVDRRPGPLDAMGVRDHRRPRTRRILNVAEPARGSGAFETDYLNGEIALLGRLHGVPTPVNDALCRSSARAAREGRAPGCCRARGGRWPAAADGTDGARMGPVRR